MILVHPFKRRMRCSVQGCKQAAAFAFGLKGNDYPVCQEHFNQIEFEIACMEGNKKPEAEPINEPVVEEKAEEAAAEIVEEPIETIEVPSEESFTCKYCGKSFPKSEMTVSQFAQHSRKCKKEHAEE